MECLGARSTVVNTGETVCDLEILFDLCVFFVDFLKTSFHLDFLLRLCVGVHTANCFLDFRVVLHFLHEVCVVIDFRTQFLVFHCCFNSDDSVSTAGRPSFRRVLEVCL